MQGETLQFKTELKQILHIIIHSLYSHKDIFLRELISNASDAIDTLRFQALTQPELTDGDGDWQIQIAVDPDAGTLTVSDNGIGMSREGIIDHLGTIARSGTRAFLERLQQADAKERPELIGQFGVGFYSAFMVADRVTVVSRHAGLPADQAVRWESTGEGEFTVESCTRDRRGTDVILHLRDDARAFLEEWTIRGLVKKYSDFVEHPVVMDVTREENNEKKIVQETLNARQAIWLRPKSEITHEQYVEFYKHLTHDQAEPAEIIHFNVEGVVEFRALLFLPANKPFDLRWGESNKGLHLYIRRVFILDDCETVLPAYLRFVRGVVDSPDLPLNVSREMIQRSPTLEKIKSNLTNKILKVLEEMKRNEFDKYVAFFRELGVFLKDGILQDHVNRELLADLMLFESTRTEPGQFTQLQTYVDGMASDQKEIYFLIGENREIIENAPVLESVKSKGYEVLLLTDAIDEFVVARLAEYKGKRLVAADKGEFKTEEVDETQKARFQTLLDLFKEKLQGEIKDARLSNRLKESAACLVAEEWGPSAHLERFMHQIGRQEEMPASKRVLEINPEHAVVLGMLKLLEKNRDDPRLELHCRVLLDEAVIAEGSRIKDIRGFAQRINELMARDAEAGS